MRVVLDTNVIISSYLSIASAPAQIAEHIRRGTIAPVVSEELLEEYERALNYPKVSRLHKMNPVHVVKQVEAFRVLAVLVQLHEIPPIIKEDPADNIVLATALQGEAAFVISGDAHLLRQCQFEGVQILSPTAFLPVLGE